MKKIPFLTLEKAKEIREQIPTPFHVYDEAGIRANARALKAAFSWNPGFKEFFAVKATPNPFLLKILHEEGCGCDCATYTELLLSEAVGITGHDVVFSSNVTPELDMRKARDMGVYINLDDATYVDFLASMGPVPETVCLRYNPGGSFSLGNTIMDMPRDAKYGMTEDQMAGAITRLMKLGTKHFGVHAFLASNTTTNEYYPALAGQLFRLAVRLRNATGAHISFIDLSGGLDPTQYIEQLGQESAEAAKNRILANRQLFKMLQENNANGGRPVVISDKEDELIGHTRGYGDKDRPEDYLDAFSEYVKTNMNQIAALNIVCTRPKDLTREDLKSLRLTLDREGYTTQQLNTAISQMTNERITADIISLIRRYAIGSALISHEARIRRAVDKLTKAHSFSKQELNWIKRMETYLMNESVLNVKVFDEDARFKEQGGFKKINKVFQNQLESIVLELNTYLYDDGGNAA